MNKYIITVGFLLFFLAHGYTQSESSDEASKIIKALVDEKGIVGVAAGYSINGELIWSEAQGYSSREEKEVISLHTRLRTASMAKSMTAIAIMQLVEQGLLDLDKPIQTYLPDYPQKKRGPFTTRHLLSHTTGMEGYASSKEAETTNEYPSLEQAMNVFQDRELAFEPGSEYNYTTYGYVVLGRVIEVLSGSSYEDYMQEHIWNVLGMQNTGVDRYLENKEHHSNLYHKKRKKAKLRKPNNLSNRIPGGGFYSTVGDMLLFGNAILDNTLISKKSLDEMLKVASPGKEGNQYGLGFFLYGPKGQENVVFGHSGGQTGASSQLFIHSRTNTVVVVMANTSGTWQHVAGAASMILNSTSEKK